MKNKLIIGALLVLSLTLAGCSNSISGEPVATNSVEMKNLSFNPNNITVSAGTEVTFTNNDSTTHTVTFDTFDSGDIGSGASYRHVFDTPGTFKYSCSPHPFMTGQVEVKQ
jgi:plastocyanin